jgi:hypothetical protein
MDFQAAGLSFPAAFSGFATALLMSGGVAFLPRAYVKNRCLFPLK